MHRNYLNIDVYVEDEVLYTRLDTSVFVLEFEESNQANHMLDQINQPDLMVVAKKFAEAPLIYQDLAIPNIMGSKHITKHLLEFSSKKLDNEFKGEPTIKSTPPIMINPNTILNGKHASIIYRISNIPHVMINWLAFFSIHLNYLLTMDKKNLIQHIQFEDHSPFDNISEVVLPSITHLYQGKNYISLDNNLVLIMEKMVNFKLNLDNYQDALTDLGKVLDAYEKDRNGNTPKPLLQFLFESTRAELVYSKQVKKFSLGNHRDKESRFLSLTLADQTTAKKLECLFMLETINASAKINLLTPCLGRIAHDKGRYKMNYTELELIYFAEFYLFPNGTMGIINLNKNFAYLQYYAVGKPNYNILSPELEHLANILDLQLERNCDYHKDQQILFTPACSIKLANLGLHLNGNYSKELFHVYQTWAFFTRLQLRGDNVFSKLPNDLLDNIIIEANSPYKGMYNNKIHPGFFQAVNRGKEKAIKEYKNKMDEEGLYNQPCNYL